MGQDQQTRVGCRLAAIVAADVAGYSRLMGLDEIGTARTLREHRKVTDALVEKHGGASCTSRPVSASMRACGLQACRRAKAVSWRHGIRLP